MELKERGIPFQQQIRFPIMYRSTEVGLYIPDLIVQRQVVVETKTIERISNHEIGQMLNYLKITGTSTGLILNFKRARLEWKRVANTIRNA